MNYTNILFFTGSGISVDSGLKTYRYNNGIWNNFSIKDVATKKAIYYNLNKVNTFFNQLREEIKNAKPNKAHFIISNISNYFNIKVITQNIDDLHERSGIKKIIHLHGFIFESIDIKRKGHVLYQYNNIKKDEKNIENNIFIRPNVVLFDEAPFYINESIKIIKKSDLIIIVGTSLSVSPANNIIFKNKTSKIIIIDPNKDIIKKIPKEFNKEIGGRIIIYNNNAIDGLMKVKKEILKIKD